MYFSQLTAAAILPLAFLVSASPVAQDAAQGAVTPLTPKGGCNRLAKAAFDQYTYYGSYFPEWYRENHGSVLQQKIRDSCGPATVTGWQYHDSSDPGYKEAYGQQYGSEWLVDFTGLPNRNDCIMKVFTDAGPDVKTC